MKKTVLIIIVVIVILAVGIGVGWYLAKNNNPADSFSQTQQPKDLKEKTLDTDDFSIKIPTGWQEVSPIQGVTAMVIKTSEEITDPAVKKINFKSYYSLAYDTLQERTEEEYLEYYKTAVQQAAPDITFTSETNTTINGNNAYVLEGELISREVDFKILMVLIKGQGDDIWVVAFNTIKDNWEENQNIIAEVVQSFMVK